MSSPFPGASKDFLEMNRELLAKEGVGADNTVPASKYHNVRAEAEGMRFASGHEAAGVAGLILLERQKKGVFGLRLQVPFPLPGGIDYIADAVYLDEKLRVHVVDFKGDKTRVYINKAKQFLEKYGQAIEEM